MTFASLRNEIMSRTKAPVKVSKVNKVKNTKKKCVHHWIIGTPSGRESVGNCKHCGTKKTFPNSNESVMWEKTRTLRNDIRQAERFSRPAEILLSDES